MAGPAFKLARTILGGRGIGRPARVDALSGRFWWRYGLSAVAVALTVGTGGLLELLFTRPLGSIGMLFLVPVLASAVSFGLGPALFTSLASVMAYNFFFLPPIYTLSISDPDNWLSFGILLFVAVIAGNLAARTRSQAELAARKAHLAEQLYQFTGKMAATTRLDDILWASSFQISAMLHADIAILLPDEKRSRLEIRGAYPPADELSPGDLTLAARVLESGKSQAPEGSPSCGAGRLFLPMRTASGPIGVIRLHRDDARPFSREESRLLDSLNDQSALAIERVQLAQKLEEARVLAEADKLRVAMLSSLSHDLRTPLASILGAATTLLSNLGLYDIERTKDMLATVREEAERLDHFVGNLLDMSRLEAGVLGVKPELVDISDSVTGATARLARYMAGRILSEEIPADLPFARADPLLLEQALFNILDNAVKYSPAGSRIGVTAALAGDRITITVEDEGPGIPAAELAHVFDKFYRVRMADRRIAGTGLGLSVARGFVESFGGALAAGNRRAGCGARFELSVPVWKTLGSE